MKANTLVPILGLSGSALGAAVVGGPSKPFGYASGSKESIANLKNKINNVVWILLENRSFDNILGGVKKRGLDNPANNGDYWNPEKVNDPNSKKWYTNPKNFDSIQHDADHSIIGNNFQFYGTETPNNEAIANGSLTANNIGFLQRHIDAHPGISPDTADREVMGYYTEKEIPTLMDLVEEYTTFNYWHSCVPGPTNPNRLCTIAGTADGHGRNDNDFDVSAIDIPNIFQTATDKGISWKNYDGTNGAFLPDALFFKSIAKNGKQNVQPVENFFQDAYLGLLPQLSYINPSCCGLDTNSMHPNGNVSFGQVFIKQIYDALRASPQWEKTLLVVTFDEAGGFYDHVPNPLAVRPDNKTYTSKAKDGTPYTFSFDRLGSRMPTWLVSPYAPEGHIENYGVDPVTGKPTAYSATSVLKTLSYLWDIKDFSPRVSHSPAFDHLIGPKPRRDAPQTLANPHVFN